MKLFSAIASVAILGASLITALPSEARPSRYTSWTGDDGTIYQITPLGSNSLQLLLDDRFSDEGFIAVRNCSTGGFRWRANTGYTEREIGDLTKIACDN